MATVSVKVDDLERELGGAFDELERRPTSAAILIVEGAATLDVRLVTRLILAGLQRTGLRKLALVRDDLSVHFLSSAINLRSSGPRVRAFKTAGEAAAWLAELTPDKVTATR